MDVAFVEKWPVLLPLSTLRQLPELDRLPLLQKGSRLSLMPVTAEQWQAIQQARATAEARL